MSVRRITAVFGFLILALSARTAAAADIDACKYMVIPELSDDRWSLASVLRDRGQALGLITLVDRKEVPANEEFKACVMTGRWLGSSVYTGILAVQVSDLVTGVPIAATELGGTNWVGMERTVKTAAENIFRRLQFTGFKESAYQARLQRLFPTRPKLQVTEAEARAAAAGSAIEGIWADRDKQYRLAIVKAPPEMESDYVGAILSSAVPIWTAGEIKLELRKTDMPAAFASTYYMQNKQGVTTTFTLDGDTLVTTLRLPSGPIEIALLRE
jgi:hypothetical protein